MLYSIQKHGLQFVITTAASQRASDIQLFIRKQAGPELSIGSQAQTVAGMAEMLAHGLDKSDFTDSSLDSV